MIDKAEAFLEKKPDGFLVVGLGASAGGVLALKEFFQHVPSSTGMAYVVILHLSPDHDSQLAQVLQVVSTIPVLKVMENTKIEQNHIYVVPPNQHLIITDDSIAPSVNVIMEDRRAPVDIFFRNLADTLGPRAVGGGFIRYWGQRFDGTKTNKRTRRCCIRAKSTRSRV